MASSSTAFTANGRSDPLEYLPCSEVVEYRKGEVIYGEGQQPTGIYLVIEGRVVITHAGEYGQVMMDIYRHDEFFGESALLNRPLRCERATALEQTRVMNWSNSEIEDLLIKRPGLSFGLLRLFIERMQEFSSRIESLSLNTIPQRLARSLVRFSERLGTPAEDGTVRMPSLTHEMLAEHLGTTRELVTQYMTLFRKKGYLQYSRQETQICQNNWQKWVA